MTNATESTEGRRRRERTLTRAIIGAIVVLLVVLVFDAAIPGGNRPHEDRFLAQIRRDHPELTVAAAPDDRLLDAARRVCSPDGLSSADEAWLDTLDVDPSAFVDDAGALCPSR